MLMLTEKSLKKMLCICVILQTKFGCHCIRSKTVPSFCSCVEELYNEYLR